MGDQTPKDETLRADKFHLELKDLKERLLALAAAGGAGHGAQRHGLP